MADNVAITAGSGTNIATDDAGSAHYQRVKLTDSTADSTAGLGVITGLVNKVVTASTAQTGTAIWTPASGKKVVVTYYQIQIGGTVAGDVQIWYGAGGGSPDTTYTRGTDYAIFDGSFQPGTYAKPGIAVPGLWCSPTADYVLRYTTSAAINPIIINIWGYEV